MPQLNSSFFGSWYLVGEELGEILLVNLLVDLAQAGTELVGGVVTVDADTAPPAAATQAPVILESERLFWVPGPWVEQATDCSSRGYDVTDASKLSYAMKTQHKKNLLEAPWCWRQNHHSPFYKS